MKVLTRALGTVFAQSLVVAAALAQSPAPYTISGQVVDQGMQAVAGVRVCAIPVVGDRPDKGVYCGTSDDDGKFVIMERDRGRFKLIYEKMSDGYIPQRWAFHRNPSVQIPEVMVDDLNRSASALVVLAPRSGVLTGKAIDFSTGLPLEDIRITLCRTADPGNCYQEPFKNAEGKFRVLTSHEPFTVRIAADGFEDWIGPDGSEKDSTPFFVASAQSLDLQVVMRRRTGAEGKAISDAEKPRWAHLPAPVQLTPADAERIDAFPRATKLEWSPVEGAVSYKAEVDFCKNRNPECINPQPLAFKVSPPLTEPSFQFNFIGAQAGRWRVWAIDKDGREGFKSPWRTFIYLR